MMFSSVQGWSEEVTIKHPWEDVVRSVQNKYPNPFNNTVLSIDTLSRSINHITKALQSVRLLSASHPMIPNLGPVKALEWSSINSSERRMVAISHNCDLRGIFKAVEHMEYSCHPENKEWTLLKHNVSVTAFPLVALTASSTSRQQAKQGIKALQWVINHRLPLLHSYPNWTVDSRLASPNLADSVAQSMDSITQSITGGNVLKSSIILPDTEGKNVTPAPEQSALPNPTYSFFADLPSSDHSGSCREQPHLASLGSHFETLSRDVTAMSDALVRRSQRVSRLFSRIDEYVVIM